MFQHVTDRERLGDYCGETVHLIPHFTDAVIQWVEQVARIPVDGTLERPDVCIIELTYATYVTYAKLPTDALLLTCCCCCNMLPVGTAIGCFLALRRRKWADSAAAKGDEEKKGKDGPPRASTGIYWHTSTNHERSCGRIIGEDDVDEKFGEIEESDEKEHEDEKRKNLWCRE
ncbi:unnamed protein product [Cylicocyclus nassatus]|uniref:CTP synthase N-terminal domain-containing protein n=1 Tax=Cylicocyclus nassatus TaxID=53992 RepID=A0AA36GP86_CYLNA|nr:unnamed protein product [Cylicocyclus nassatus]